MNVILLLLQMDNINNSVNINEIFENALQDPSLLSNIDIDELLGTLETSKNDYLENKTIDSVNNEIFEKIKDLELSIITKQQYCDKLIGYRLVDELHELHKGKHVRWIRIDNAKLTNGGIVVDIKFMDKGIQVLCRNSTNKFIQYKYDECITFQKLNETEQVIMMAYSYANK